MGEGRGIVAAEVTRKYLLPYRFRKLGDNRDRSGQVFCFGASDVKILAVSLVLQITGVRDERGVKHIASIIRMKMKSRSTCALVVVDDLLRQTLVLSNLDQLLQRRDCLVLGLCLSTLVRTLRPCQEIHH